MTPWLSGRRSLIHRDPEPNARPRNTEMNATGRVTIAQDAQDQDVPHASIQPQRMASSIDFAGGGVNMAPG